MFGTELELLRAVSAKPNIERVHEIDRITETLAELAAAHSKLLLEPELKAVFEKIIRLLMAAAADGDAQLRAAAIRVFAISYWEKYSWWSFFRETNCFDGICCRVMKALDDESPTVRVEAIKSVFRLEAQIHKEPKCDYEVLIPTLLNLASRAQREAVRSEAIHSIELLLWVNQFKPDPTTEFPKPPWQYRRWLSDWTTYLRRVMEGFEDEILTPRHLDGSPCCRGPWIDALYHALPFYNAVQKEVATDIARRTDERKDCSQTNPSREGQSATPLRSSTEDVNKQLHKFEQWYSELFLLIASKSTGPHSAEANCRGSQMVNYLLDSTDGRQLLGFRAKIEGTRRSRRILKKFALMRGRRHGETERPWTHYDRIMWD